MFQRTVLSDLLLKLLKIFQRALSHGLKLSRFDSLTCVACGVNIEGDERFIPSTKNHGDFRCKEIIYNY